MIGDYKLSRVKNGIGYFAHVVVEAMLSEKEFIIDAIGHQVNRNECEVNAETHKDWINAAIEGANYTLKHIKQLDEINKYDVKIIKVIGLETDTTEDAVRTAASIATWRAINLNCPEPEPVFDKNWYVVYPVRNHNPLIFSFSYLTTHKIMPNLKEFLEECENLGTLRLIVTSSAAGTGSAGQDSEAFLG